MARRHYSSGVVISISSNNFSICCLSRPIGAAMKRSALKPSSKPLKRSPFNRVGMLGIESFARVRKTLKKSRPKMTPIRKSAKDQNCTLRFKGICRNQTESTVWCHGNRSDLGKGIGLKARDECGCYGCSLCHAYLDGGWASDKSMTWDAVQLVFDRASAESQEILRNRGLI